MVWDSKTRRIRNTLSGHQKPVDSITFTRDGTELATGGEDFMAQVWNATTGKSALTMTEHFGEIVAIAFSPDGKTLATASMDNTIKLWKLDR
jgi:WD40 repeat protein